jgi:hypothetical protein
VTNRSAFKKIIQDVAQQQDLTCAEVEEAWWYDQRSSDGLRLTAFAHRYLLEINVEFYSFDLDAGLARKPKVLLDLDRRMTCAYYLQTKRPVQLSLFGSREAMMLTLYGDLEKFLSNTGPRSGQ